MALSRFYQDVDLVVGNTVALDARNHRHVVHVLRKRIGDEVVLFNGQGGEYVASIASCDKRNSSVVIDAFRDVDRESNLQTHLALALSRGERMDYALQKAVELGVTHITPLLTQHSTLRLNADKIDARMRHWQGVICHAAEQSGRTALPQLDEPQTLATFLASCQSDLKWLFETCGESATPKSDVRVTRVCMLVGGEGGWHDDEVALAKDHGFNVITLGPRIFRTETAPVVALTLAQAYYGDFIA